MVKYKDKLHIGRRECNPIHIVLHKQKLPGNCSVILIYTIHGSEGSNLGDRGGRSPCEAETLSAFGRSLEVQKLINYIGFSFSRTSHFPGP